MGPPLYKVYKITERCKLKVGLWKYNIQRMTITLKKKANQGCANMARGLCQLLLTNVQQRKQLSRNTWETKSYNAHSKSILITKQMANEVNTHCKSILITKQIANKVNNHSKSILIIKQKTSEVNTHRKSMLITKQKESEVNTSRVLGEHKQLEKIYKNYIFNL